MTKKKKNLYYKAKSLNWTLYEDKKMTKLFLEKIFW